MTPEQTLEATFRAGHLAQARQMAVAILQRNPHNKTALQVLAHIALLIGVTSEALAIAGKAHLQDANDPRTNLLLAEIHGSRGHTDEALAYCERVFDTHPDDPSTVQIKAKLLERAGRWQAAMELLEPLAASTPRAPLLSLTLARCWIRAGRLDDAIALLDASLADVAGETARARQQRASLQGLKARALDRAGRYDEAWQEAAAANVLHQIDYDPQTYADEVDRLIAWFSATRLGQLPRAGKGTNRHVFIVGMPRSGTTLAEQILDAHAQVTGLGEIKDLDVLARMLPQAMQLKMPFPDCLEYADATRLDRMVEAYELGIEQQGFGPAPVYVNKNLRNPVLLGLIALMFPAARIILCWRDPRDTGVSSFMAGMNHELFPYLFDVDHIAAAMRDYARLIAHWRKVLPLEFMDLQYADLVNDQETETRRLLEFCELDWDGHCLNYWESPRTVMTQSYDQVTRPIYAHAVGRHENYTKHIAPLQQLVDGE